MKKLAAIVCGALVLGFVFSAAHADGEGKSKAETSGGGSGTVVASETGAWSKEVNGLKGRLIVSPGSVFNETQMPTVYLELRNVSDVLNPLEIYYNNANVKGTVTDKSGKGVENAGLPASIMSPLPYWLVLPFDSSLRFRISVTGYGVPKKAGALMGLDSGAWLLKSGGDGTYFLQGTFKSVVHKGKDEQRQWQGTLELPKVRIPLTAS